MYCIKCGGQTNNPNSICNNCQNKASSSSPSKTFFLVGRIIMVILTGIAALPFYLLGIFAFLISLVAEDSIASLIYFPVLIIKCFMDFPLDTFVTVFMWIAPVLQIFGVCSMFIPSKKGKKKNSFKADIYFIISALCLIYYNHSKEFLGFLDNSNFNFVTPLSIRKAISIVLLIFAIIDIIGNIIAKKSLEESDNQNLEQMNPNGLNNDIELLLPNDLIACPYCRAQNQASEYCEYCGQKIR